MCFAYNIMPYRSGNEYFETASDRNMQSLKPQDNFNMPKLLKNANRCVCTDEPTLSIEKL